MVEDSLQPNSSENFFAGLKLFGELREFVLANRKFDSPKDVEVIQSASITLAEITAVTIPILSENGMEASEFLEEIARKVVNSREEMDRAKRIYPLMEPNFEHLDEDEKREAIFTLSDNDFMFVRREVIRRTRDPRPSDNPEALRMLVKEFHAEWEDQVLHLDERWSYRRQNLQLPKIGPTLIYFESSDEKVNRVQDWLKNTSVQEVLGVELGILEEGEQWQNFVRRKDTIVRGPERIIRTEDYDDTDLTVGYRAGWPAEYGREGVVYYGGLPTYISTTTRFPGVRASVSFSPDSGGISRKGDVEIPLDQLILAGLATPRLTLEIPTNYFL